MIDKNDLYRFYDEEIKDGYLVCIDDILFKSFEEKMKDN